MAMEMIEAVFKRAIFTNTQTNFLIGDFESPEKNKINFVAIGNMYSPEPGMGYKLWGEWKDHRKYGKQFSFSSFSDARPKNKKAIFKYLVRIAKWVGPAIGNAIVEKYGIDTIDVLKANPDRVANDINGITIERAKEIQAHLIENEQKESAMVALEEILDIPGVPKSLVTKIIDKHGSNSVKYVMDKPYELTSIYGVGFLTVDKVALKLGIDPGSTQRKSAAIMHIIKENMQNDGSVWIHRDVLLKRQMELVGSDQIDGYYDLIDSGQLVKDEDGAVTTVDADMDEKMVAVKLFGLLKI
jgi:exodeoxyribonuclease V alpha subunit